MKSETGATLKRYATRLLSGLWELVYILYIMRSERLLRAWLLVLREREL